MSTQVSIRKKASAPAVALHMKVDTSALYRICPHTDPEALHPCEVGTYRARDVIEQQRKVCSNLEPFTPARTRELRDCIEATLQVRTNAGLAAAILRLLAGYIYAKPSDETRHALEEQLAQFPDAVVAHAVFKAHRDPDMEFFSIQKFYALCVSCQETWRLALTTLGRIDRYRIDYAEALEKNVALIANPPALPPPPGDRDIKRASLDRIAKGLANPYDPSAPLPTIEQQDQAKRALEEHDARKAAGRQPQMPKQPVSIKELLAKIPAGPPSKMLLESRLVRDAIAEEDLPFE